MSAPDARAFLSRLRDSGLFSETELHEVDQLLVPDPQDARARAQALVEHGLLNQYQAEQLLMSPVRLRYGPYRVIDEIGAGGMGRVYKALHGYLDRTVALKVLPESQRASPDARARFLREVRAGAKLTHPNVVTTYDGGEEDGLIYFAMEYVDGRDLRRVVAGHGRLEPSHAADIARQVALALEHARQQGIVHRDIKPSNIMLANDGTPKVLDMGLARFEGSHPDGDPALSLTRPGTTLGTIDFMAPEQALDAHAADTRADIYSLGCTLYYILAATIPFPGGSETERLLKRQVRQPVPLGERTPDVPQALADIVAKMMAKAPEDRYQTPAEVVGALDAFLGAVPEGPSPGSTITVTVHPPPPPPDVPKTFENSVHMKMVYICPGRFLMGGDQSPEDVAPLGGGNAELLTDEHPVHPVRITTGFYMSAFPVTNWQYRQFEPDHDSGNTTGGPLSGDDQPVVKVSWQDAKRFCQWLTEQEGRTYRLPTEAEWEYACRAGTTTPFAFGETISTDLANYHGNYTYGEGPKGEYRKCTTPMGTFDPNPWGLYDMHGNVWEWCEDWYSADYYGMSPEEDPPGPQEGTARVLRGGSWRYPPLGCRAALRFRSHPTRRFSLVNGFRVLLSPRPSG